MNTQTAVIEPIQVIEEQPKEPSEVDKVKEVLGSEDGYAQAGELFGVLADPTRLRLIAALVHKPLCVSELSQVVGLGQSATSHALRILRDRGIARAEREGQQVRYHLADKTLRDIISMGWRHALEEEPPVAICPPVQFTGEIRVAGEESEGKKKKKKKKKKKDD